MKMAIFTKSIMAAVLLTGSTTLLLAQTAPTSTCPFGHEPGFGRSLTPEQRAAHQATMQEAVATLQAKLDAGTITAEELAWLEQAEQRGGPCINGTPRGPRAGKGQGMGWGRQHRQGQGKGQGMRWGCSQGQGQGQGPGAGRGQRRGLRDGTGPCSANGTCPLGNAPAQGTSR